MAKLRNAFFVLLAVQAVAFAADPALLNLVMPDAKVIAGVQVDQAKNSMFGQYVLSHMQPDDASFKKFMADTGFDPRRDVSEIVMVSNFEHNTPESRWLIVARGVFNPARIAGSVQANGGVITNFQGVDILSGLAKGTTDTAETAIAFFDGSTAALGDLASVKGAIQRRQSKAAASSSLLGKVRDVSLKNDFWFVTLVPISEFADAMPDANLQGAMRGDLMHSISQASGGVKFGVNVLVSGEAVTRSDKDASALADVIRFLAGLIQQSRDNNGTAGQISTMLDNLELKTAANVLTMSLAIPERQLEQMMESMRGQRNQAQRRIQ
jgi:hypothetical protein